MHRDVGRQFKKLTVFLDGDSHLLAPAHFPASCVRCVSTRSRKVVCAPLEKASKCKMTYYKK